jgi:ACS family pantothenate transporter-like MFS transporter
METLMTHADRQAFANAYVCPAAHRWDCDLTALQVAGLREDLKLKGNEYSILLSMFTAG